MRHTAASALRDAGAACRRHQRGTASPDAVIAVASSRRLLRRSAHRAGQLSGGPVVDHLARTRGRAKQLAFRTDVVDADSRTAHVTDGNGDLATALLEAFIAVHGRTFHPRTLPTRGWGTGIGHPPSPASAADVVRCRAEFPRRSLPNAARSSIASVDTCREREHRSTVPSSTTRSDSRSRKSVRRRTVRRITRGPHAIPQWTGTRALPWPDSSTRRTEGVRRGS